MTNYNGTPAQAALAYFDQWCDAHVGRHEAPEGSRMRDLLRAAYERGCFTADGQRERSVKQVREILLQDLRQEFYNKAQADLAAIRAQHPPGVLGREATRNSAHEVGQRSRESHDLAVKVLREKWEQEDRAYAVQFMADVLKAAALETT